MSRTASTVMDSAIEQCLEQGCSERKMRKLFAGEAKATITHHTRRICLTMFTFASLEIEKKYRKSEFRNSRSFSAPENLFD